MILVLSNADFSDKNIGHVDFNIPLSNETLALMDYATKYPKVLENEYAQALNAFVNTLVTAGIYSKLSVLVVPSMSSTIDECTKNQLTGANCISPTIFKNLYGLRSDNNLYRKQFNFEDKTDQCGYTITHDYDDFSMFCFYKAGSTRTDLILGTSASGWQQISNSIRWSNTSYGSVTCGGSAVNKEVNKSILDNTYLDSSPFVVNYESGTCKVRYANRQYEGTYSVPPLRTAQMIKFNPLLYSSANSESNGELMIYGCGSKLTDVEMKILYDAIETFSTHFL